MKEYCVDLKIAKELKENGFPQGTLFEWCLCQEKFVENKQWRLFFADLNEDSHRCSNNTSAPTSDELLKELPKEVDYYFCFSLEILCLNSTYKVFYECNIGDTLIEFTDKKLSNALAKMWLYLKKEGYIK